nr:alpha/beta hydrolase fold domain-containing protein [Oleomonas cavernae]
MRPGGRLSPGPEHPFPAAVEDAVAAYRHLIGRGIEPRRICIAGDSAGGGLTIATMLALRDQNLPLPGAGFCISPWVELANNLPSMAAKNDVDPMVTKPRLDQMAAIYALDRPLSTPLLSPLHAGMTGLPPVLIHVGSAETLLDDSVRLAGVLGAAAVETRLEIWPEMIHVWHFFAGMLSEGRDAITSAGAWIGSKIAA